MAHRSVTKFYVLVDLATSMVAGKTTSSYGYNDSDPDPNPSPISDPGYEAVHVDSVTLNGLTEQQFFDQKKAVLSEGAFDHWEDRHTGMNLTPSESPKSDGSNTPYVTMADGLPNSPYKATASPGLSLNSKATGVLDGTGDGSFRVKVADGSLTGSITVSPDGHSDFKPVTLVLTIDGW